MLNCVPIFSVIHYILNDWRIFDVCHICPAISVLIFPFLFIWLFIKHKVKEYIR